MGTPEGWTVDRLADLSEFIGRGQAPSYVDRPTGTFAVSQKCVRNGRVTVDAARPHDPGRPVKPAAFLRSGDVCVNSTGTGTAGRVGLWSEAAHGRYFADTHVTIVRSRPDVADPKFITECLLSAAIQKRMEDECFSGSTNQIELSRTAFSELEVQLPPLPEQRKIAAILSSVDETIEKTEAVIEQLQVVKKAMMQELLTRGMPGRHTRFKQTDIGEIPEDWEVVSLETIADVERGKFSHRPRNDPRFFGGPYPFIQTGDVAACDGLITSYTQTLNDRGLLVSRLFKAGTIVVTIAANIGDTGIAAFDVAFPDSLVGVTAGPRVSNRYLELVLRSRKEELDAAAPQNAQKNINLQVLRPLLVPLPSIDEQTYIADAIGAFTATLRHELASAESLRALKAALGASLLCGDLRVTPDEATP